MSNRESRIGQPYVHVLLALARPCHGEKSACIRSVDKGRGDDVEVLEAKLRVIGGYWRIHRTVNARDCGKALKHLLCTLIQHPEKASYVDSEWRTALLQPDCIYGDKKFMLDVDFKDLSMVEKIIAESNGTIVKKVESPKGWHIITWPFDTRNVCSIENVTLIRDGYYFVKEINTIERR